MDELPPRARALLEVAQGTDDPDDVDRIRIDAKFRRLLAGFGLPLMAPPDPASAAAPGAASATGEAMSASAGAAATGGGGLTLAAGLAAAVAVGAGSLWALSGSERGGPPAPIALPALVVATAASTPEPAPLPEPAAVPVETSLRAAADTPAPAPHTVRAVHSRTRRRAPAQAANGGDLLREIELVSDASRALSSGRYQHSLGLLADYGERFPRGHLRDEQRALRVLALCGAGRLDEGRREKRRLLKHDRAGALAGRLRDACSVAPGAALDP